MVARKQAITLKGNIITDLGIQKGFIRVEEGVISDVGDIKPDSEVLDAGDSYIVPGFIDLHTHGVHYFRVDNGPEDLAGMCRIFPQYGVTGFLPTVIPRPMGEDTDFLGKLSGAITDGAEILGFHLEGPFLKLTGAIIAEALSDTNISRAESLIQASKPYMAIFSVSPDVDGIENLLPIMSVDKTPVFMTHTAATVKQTQAAIESGVLHATHFYDVFPCPPVQDLGVRPCGAVEAVLADRRVSVDFILDGVHVDPVAVQMAILCKSKGPGCVCLITDSSCGSRFGSRAFCSR